MNPFMPHDTAALLLVHAGTGAVVWGWVWLKYLTDRVPPRESFIERVQRYLSNALALIGGCGFGFLLLILTEWIFFLAPFPTSVEEVTVISKKVVSAPRQCKYQVTLEFEPWNEEWLCVDETHFNKLKLGKNELQIKSTPIGYFIK
ncbi:MAG: hypothetical protein U0998_06065 [Moraxellaceae bacterium]|nr:hypothetical protein [Moraxellaceae bacterium]MDZ4386768.1 hypothetical protein [Moraxellaceae bacterium]